MDGALFLAETQLEVEMADDTPMGIAAKIDPPAMDILTEFKILANTGVAQKISQGFPDIALLQSQSPPNERKLHDLTNYLRGLGYSIDPSSAQTLQASVDAIENPDAKAVITTLVLKTLRPVKYFCTGSFDISRWHHYGMNLPLYTEFTSPSRKYACLIVHRQLEAVLAKGKKKMHTLISPPPSSPILILFLLEKRFYLDPEYVQKIAQHCNAKEQSIINAREQAQHLLLSKFLTTSRQTSTTHEAIVVGVQELAFDVIVPSLGLERRIHVMNLPLRTSHYSQNEGVLNLFWLPGVPTSDAMVEQADFDDRDDDDYSMMGDDYNNNYRHHPDGGNNRVNDQTLHRLSVSENVLVENPTSGPLPTSPTKRRPRSMSLRAVDGESIASQQHCTIPQECCLVVRPFDFIRVVITTDSIRNPPLIRVLASNPFVHHEN
jgi:protein SSD1